MPLIPVYGFVSGDTPTSVLPTRVAPPWEGGISQAGVKLHPPAPDMQLSPLHLRDADVSHAADFLTQSKVGYFFKKIRVYCKDKCHFSEKRLSEINEEYQDVEITRESVYALAHTLTQYYRDKGQWMTYALPVWSRVAQKQGEFAFRIVQGVIATVEIRGSIRHRIRKKIAGYLEALKGVPLTSSSALDQALFYVAQLPGVHVMAVLSPDDLSKGTFRLLLHVLQEKSHLGLVYDNRGAVGLDRQRYILGLHLHSQLGHTGETQGYILTGRRGARVWAAGLSHTAAVGHYANRMTVSVKADQVRPVWKSSLVPTFGTVKGESVRGSVLYQYLGYRNKWGALFGEIGFSIGNARLRDPVTQLRYYRDNTRRIQLGFRYINADRYLGVNHYTLYLYQGLNVLGAAKSTTLSRLQAVPVYTKLCARFYREQYMGTHLSSFLSLKAQYAFSPLTVEHAFSFGGHDWGAGYEPSQWLADHGVAARGGVQLDVPATADYYPVRQYYVFYDIGKVWNRNTLGGVPFLHRSGSAADVGGHIQFTPFLEGRIELVKTLTRYNPQRHPSGGNKTVYFSFTAHI